MTGHNHYSDCLCGWWVGGFRGSPPPKPPKPRAPSFTIRSITIPNAACPVCGEVVFFYQNAFGSRVFFDELGPPWPKHPCTDNSAYRALSISKSWLVPGLRRPDSESTIIRASWMAEDWIALRLEKHVAEDEWTLLRCTEIESGQLVRILVADRIEAEVGLPIFMKPWSDLGTTTISFTTTDLFAEEVSGFKFADWFLRSPSDLPHTQ